MFQFQYGSQIYIPSECPNEFSVIQQLIQQQFELTEPIQLKYRDEEGEDITVSTEREWNELRQTHTNEGRLVMNVITHEENGNEIDWVHLSPSSSTTHSPLHSPLHETIDEKVEPNEMNNDTITLEDTNTNVDDAIVQEAESNNETDNNDILRADVQTDATNQSSDNITIKLPTQTENSKSNELNILSVSTREVDNKINSLPESLSVDNNAAPSSTTAPSATTVNDTWSTLVQSINYIKRTVVPHVKQTYEQVCTQVPIIKQDVQNTVSPHISRTITKWEQIKQYMADIKQHRIQQINNTFRNIRAFERKSMMIAATTCFLLAFLLIPGTIMTVKFYQPHKSDPSNTPFYLLNTLQTDQIRLHNQFLTHLKTSSIQHTQMDSLLHSHEEKFQHFSEILNILIEQQKLFQTRDHEIFKRLDQLEQQINAIETKLNSISSANQFQAPHESPKDSTDESADESFVNQSTFDEYLEPLRAPFDQVHTIVHDTTHNFLNDLFDGDLSYWWDSADVQSNKQVRREVKRAQKQAKREARRQQRDARKAAKYAKREAEKLAKQQTKQAWNDVMDEWNF